MYNSKQFRKEENVIHLLRSQRFKIETINIVHSQLLPGMELKALESLHNCDVFVLTFLIQRTPKDTVDHTKLFSISDLSISPHPESNRRSKFPNRNNPTDSKECKNLSINCM